MPEALPAVVVSSLNVAQASVAGVKPRLAAMVTAMSVSVATRAATVLAGRR